MSHPALLDAVHVHPVAVESVVVPDAPVAGTDTDVALKLYVQPDACVTVNATPPMLTVPLRAAPAFAVYE